MSRNLIPLVIILFVIIGGISGVFFLVNPKEQNNSNINLTPVAYKTQSPTPVPTSVIITPTVAPETSGASSSATTMPDGLQIQDITIGTGDQVKSGDTVTVNYLGTLVDGTKFDSSYDRNTPFTTQIGVGQVIRGWDEGIVGMKTGGKRRLVVPAQLGYGSQSVGGIPPNSTLIFEVELVSVK